MIQNRNGYVPGEKVITTDRLVPIKQDIKKLDERVSELEHCCEELDEELVTEKIIVDELQVNGNTYLGNIESSGVHCACSFVGNNASISDITTENITVNNCATIKDAHIEKAVIDNLTFEEETVDDITINCHLQVDGSSCFTNTINGNITNADTATNIAANPIIHSCDGLTYDEWGTKFCVQVGDKCSNEISVNQATSAYTSETSNNAENANKFDFCSANDWRDYIASQIPTCAADTAKFAGKDCDEWKTIIKETCVDNAVSADTATNLASNPQLSLGSIDCCAITVTAGNMTSQEFTVPYASEASTAGLANNSTCFDGKTYAEVCADILSGCAAKADEATCLKDAPVLSCNGSCIYVTAGNKNSNCITVPYSKCSAATLISASGADTTFPIVMDSTAGNASGYHSFIKDCGNNLTYNPSKDVLQSPNITATNCLKGDLVCAKTCITTPKIEATCVITCGVCNNGNSNINGDVNIGGDLYVTGTAHYTHSEEVITQSENIILRDEATTPVPSGHYSGFVVTNYDGNGNDLEVGADSAGTLKIGTCTSNMEAVATRDDSDNMEDSYATKWCASCKKIVTSGISCTHDLCVNGDACATGSVTANAFCGSLVGNADTATDATCFGGHTYADACADILSGNAACASKLSTSCCINGTAFDGSSNITTAKWGAARNIQISDCDGTNASGTVSVDGSANVCLKLPSTIKATLTGKADSAKAVTTCPTTVNATCYLTMSANNTAGDKQIYTNTNLKYNPSTGALSATTFCGSFTGTSDNATCFDGHTYSCACADIRSGLTSCTGTVTCVKIGSGTAITPDANGQICLPDYPPDLSSCPGINCVGTVVTSDLNCYQTKTLGTSVTINGACKTTVQDAINTLNDTYPKKAYFRGFSESHCACIFLGCLPVSSGVVSYGSMTLNIFSNNNGVPGGYPIGTVQIDVSSGSNSNAFNIRGYTDIPLNNSDEYSPKIRVSKDSSYHYFYLDDKYNYVNVKLEINRSNNFYAGSLSACSSMAGTEIWNSIDCSGITYINGLTSCTGTVTGVTVNGVAGTGTGAITVSNVPACGGCANTADCSKTVCVVAENTDSAYAIPFVNGWNCATIANATLKGSSNRQLTFNPSQGVLDSRFVHVVCNVKTPAVTSAPTYNTATDIVFCTHKADNTWLDTVKMSSNGLLCGRLYGVGSTSNYNFKIPFSSATGGLTSGTVSSIVHLNHVDSQDTFTYNPSTNTLRVLNIVSDTGRFDTHATVPTIYSKPDACISCGSTANLTFVSRCKNSSGTLSNFCSCICGSNGIYYNSYGINLNGYPQKHGKVIDLSAQSCCNFYPVTYQAANPYEADIEIDSPGVVGACPFNQNYIHYLHRSGGWGDTPKTFAVLTNKRFDNAEITIGSIGQATTDSTLGVVWLRGGLKYYTYSNVDLTVHTSNWTHGQSTFTVGTTYCGSGTNTCVSYSLAAPINETTQFESMRVSGLSNVGSIYSPQTNNTLTGIEFYGHRADNTNKIVACANGNGLYRALYGECGNANYKIPFTTLSGTTAAGTTALTLDRVTTEDTFTYNAMCNVLRVGTVCGALKSGTYVTCTPTTPGQAGTYIAPGGIEVLAANPYVDFHHNNACADYSARLINSAAGRADIIVNNATGCCASTCSSTFQFCYDGILNAPYFSSDRTVKGEFGHSNEFNLTSCTGIYMWLNYRGGSKEIKVGNGNGAGGLGVVCAACFCGGFCGTVANATNAVNATNATNAAFATNAGNAANASNAGFATNAGSLCDYAFTACCDRNVVITEGPSGGYAHHGTSTVCPLTFNPATGVLTAKCFCGCVTATGTIDNATCFAGCTYASAKTDIRSGLTSCTGTVTISNSNANSSIPVVLCTGSTSVGKSTGNALCYNPFTGALCARQFNSTTAGIAIGNICGDASASGNYSIAIGNSASSGPNMSIAIGKNARTFNCGSAVVCSVVGCTATIYIPDGTKRCDAYKLLFTDTNNMLLFNGMYWSAIGQSNYQDTLGQFSSVTRLSYSYDAKAFYVNGFPIWNGATNVELTIDTFQATDTTTTSKWMLFTYTRIAG